MDKRKIGMFVNTQNMAYPDLMIDACKKVENMVDIFVGNKCSESLETLGIDVEASIYDYDYVIMINPTLPGDDEEKCITYQRQMYYVRNLIGDEEHLKSEIELLDNSKWEAMLVSPADYIMQFAKDHYIGWEDTYRYVKSFIEENKLNVIIGEEKRPVIAEGGCAIIQVSALEGIEKLKCEELTPEIISCILPVYVQSQGKLPSIAMEHTMLLNNMMGTKAYNDTYGQIMCPIMKTQYEVYFDTGDGFIAEKVESHELKVKIGVKQEHIFEIEVPENVRYIRFDPCEGFMCICTGIKVDADGITIHNVNGLQLGKDDLFLTKDPQYILAGDFQGQKKLKITIENLSIFWSNNALDEEMNKFFDEREEFVKSIDHLQNAYQQLEKSHCQEREELIKSIAYLQDAYQQMEQSRNQCAKEIEDMINSKSWKATAWMRKLSSLFKC